MKYFSIFLILYCLASGVAAQEFTVKESKLITQQVDSIVSLYVKYGSFTADNSKISESYVEAFKSLFSKPDAYVYNDLDQRENSPKKIILNDYVKYVKRWFNMGLSIELSNKKIENPVKAVNLVTLDVRLEKNIIGWHNDNGRMEIKCVEIFNLVFPKDLSSCKIKDIRQVETNRCQVLSIADKYYAEQNYEKALQYYQDAIKNCGDQQEIEQARSQYTLISNLLREQKYKPFYMTIQLSPAFDFYYISSESSFTPDISAGMQIGFSLNFIKMLYKDKKGKTLIGVGAGLGFHNLTMNLSVPDYKDSVAEQIDIDKEAYTLLYDLKDLKETVHGFYADVPIFGSLRYNFSKKCFLLFNLGVQFSLLANSTYNSVNTGEYKGRYYEYNNIILWGNQLSDYGFGTYNTSLQKQKEKYLNSFVLSGFSDIGLGFQFSRSINAFLSFTYITGFNSMTKSGGDNVLSYGKDEVSSLLKMNKILKSSFGINFGIGITLN